MPVVIAEVVDTELDVAAHLRAVEDSRQGAITSFVGRVRDHDPQVAGTVAKLSYSAHPAAGDLINKIANDVVAQHDPDSECLVAVTHRVGDLGVGEVALVAAVSSPHRVLAFRVCGELVEEIKRSLPIWKKQFDVDGGSVWSGLTDPGS